MPAGQTDQQRSFFFVAITTALWVTAATVVTAIVLVIGTFIAFSDTGDDGWGVVTAIGIALGGGILGGYILWSTVALIKNRGQIGAVLAGVALIPGLIGTSYLWNVVSESAKAGRQEHAERVLGEFKQDFAIEETERDHSTTTSFSGCSVGKATSRSAIASHEDGFELITEVQATLVDQGWKITTGLHVSESSGERGDEEQWTIAATKGNEAIVYEMQFWAKQDGSDYTYGKTETYVGSCVRDMDITDLHWRFDETSPLPKTVPDLRD